MLLSGADITLGQHERCHLLAIPPTKHPGQAGSTREPLGNGRHGPIHAQDYWLCCPHWECRWSSALPYVQRCHFWSGLATVFWTATDLANKLRDYQAYYNEKRCHSSRDGATPDESGRENIIALTDCRWKKHCRGLFQLPVAA